MTKNILVDKATSGTISNMQPTAFTALHTYNQL